MDFAVGREQVALRTPNRGRVVELVVASLRNGAGNQKELQLLGNLFKTQKASSNRLDNGLTLREYLTALSMCGQTVFPLHTQGNILIHKAS